MITDDKYTYNKYNYTVNTKEYTRKENNFIIINYYFHRDK